jgi:hypothetical protein
MQTRSGSDDNNNPAFTMRRHILHAKEDNIQLEQMKKVDFRKIFRKKIFVFSRQSKNG